MNYPETIPFEFASDKSLADAYRRGWNHGHGVACQNVPKIGDLISRAVDWVGLARRVTAENIREYHGLLCDVAVDHSRYYSPFEHTASEFNGAENSEELWEAFEDGTADSIAFDLATYTDEDYGIEPDEDDEEDDEDEDLD